MVRAQILEKLTQEQRKTIRSEEGGKYIQATVVQAERVVVDEDEVFDFFSGDLQSVTKMVFDRQAFEKALDTMDDEKRNYVISRAVSVKPSAPYVRFSSGLVTDDSSPYTSN